MDAVNRIREVIEDKKLNIKEFSSELEIPYRTMQRYLAADRALSADFLQAMTEVFGVSASWILSGVGPKWASIDGQDYPNQTSGLKDCNGDEAEFVPIPRYTVSASAGHGDSFIGDPMDVTYYAFSLQWIKRRHLDPDMLHIVQVKGDSMEPTLSNGDLILVDRAQAEPSDGKTFVVRIWDELVVKNIQRVAKDTISLISANTIYPPREISEQELGPTADIEIVGRVVASMHEW